MALAGAVVFSQFLSPTMTQAQADEQSQAGDRLVCLIETLADEEQNGSVPGSQVVVALCNGMGINLGPADRHEVFSNIGLNALVVAIEHLGRTRIMLLASEEGQVFVEDLSGALAVAAGRTPTGGLRDVNPDFARFGENGTIRLDAVDVAQRGLGGETALFSLDDHLARARSYRVAARAAQTGSDQ